MFRRLKAREMMDIQGRKNTWIARLLDLKPETITRYLSGERPCPKPTAIAWAVKLGLPEDELWDVHAEQQASRRAG